MTSPRSGTTAFRFAHASDVDWRRALATCIESLGAIPAPANLGFVYVTDSFDPALVDIVEELKRATGLDDWVGTVGLGICSAGIEYFDTPAIAVMLGEFPPGAFRLFRSNDADLAEFDAAHARWCAQVEPYFGIVHADPGSAGLVQHLEGLAERMGGGFLVGGIASSRSLHHQVAGDAAPGGISGAMFSREVGVSTRLTQGCSPIGPRHRVTESGDNIIVSLDGRPALDVFRDDIGEVLARNLRQTAGFIFAGIPVRGSDTGDYLVRNLLGLDEQNGLLAIGEAVSPGDYVMFCRRDARTAEEDLRRMARELARTVDGPPRGAVYYTCLARGPNLFGSNSEELRIIEDELGPVPLVGFFGNGEVSNGRLYGYTGVLTLFT